MPLLNRSQSKQKKKNLKERREKSEKLAESLKIYLANVLDGEKFKTSRVSISFRTSEAVEVDDMYKLPDNYISLKVEMSPKKNELKQALKSGMEFEGVRIVKNKNIQIK